VFGAGISSTVISSSGSVCRGVHIVGGQDLTFEDLQVACPTSTGGDDGFWVQSATNVNFYRVKVYKTVYGFHALGCTYFGVYDSQMIQTRSAGVQIDGTTTTGRSYSVTISRNYAYQTGDDVYASVGYNGVQNQYVGFYNNTSDQPGLITGGSGITVGGSQYVEVHGNTVTGAAHGAGIRVESERAWGEGASNQVDVYNNNLSELHPTDPANQPAILVYSNTGASISDLHVHQNQVHNPHNYHVFYLYAINGGAIAPYQIQNNTVFDNSGSVDPARMIDLGPGLGGAAISGNYLNGVLIW
jgi:hypothetical protein